MPRGCQQGRVVLGSDYDAHAFWCRVQRGKLSDCWPIAGTRNSKGYVYYSHRGVSALAHRVAYAIRYGRVPARKVVMHKCDNPPCCNPHHLQVGTQRDNLMDARQKGRWAPELYLQNAHKANRNRRLRVGSTCRHGHAITAETLRITSGRHYCRVCDGVRNGLARAAYRQNTAARIRGMLSGVLPATWDELSLVVDSRRADAFASAYGLFGRPLESLTAIGARFGLTRERIRQYVVETEHRLGLVRTTSRRAGLRVAA